MASTPPAIGHLYRVILPVPDIERATRFYQTLLGTPGQRVSSGRHYFDCGGTILACYDPMADGDDEQVGWRFHPLQYFYIAVPDLAAAFRAAEVAGALIEQPIQSMPWGETLFYCRDPFGSGLCFVEAATKFTGP
jgi:predicted enzyme related to lactoylglutathione lyase